MTKLGYCEKVLTSCKTRTQLDNSIDWVKSIFRENEYAQKAYLMGVYAGMMKAIDK